MQGLWPTKKIQQHIITECKAVHKDKDEIKIGLNDLFDTDQNNMKKTAKKTNQNQPNNKRMAIEQKGKSNREGRKSKKKKKKKKA